MQTRLDDGVMEKRLFRGVHADCRGRILLTQALGIKLLSLYLSLVVGQPVLGRHDAKVSECEKRKCKSSVCALLTIASLDLN